MYMNT